METKINDNALIAAFAERIKEAWADPVIQAEYQAWKERKNSHDS